MYKIHHTPETMRAKITLIDQEIRVIFQRLLSSYSKSEVELEKVKLDIAKEFISKLQKEVDEAKKITDFATQRDKKAKK